jgi:hypothetical protein
MTHPHAIEAAKRMDKFAEALSESPTLKEAYYRAGITRNRANKYLARIKKRLGPQAC